MKLPDDFISLCICLVWLIGFADGRRKVKDALYYSVFKERAEAIEKAPSLSMPKS